MTLLTEPERPLAVLTDDLGPALSEIADRHGVHCLVEAEGGTAIAHAVRYDPPAALVQAVLRRSTAPLSAALLRQRSVGLLHGGAVLTAALPGWEGVVHSAPLVRAGQRLGWLWLLGQQRLATDCLAKITAAVAEACPMTPPDQAASAVRAALDDDRPLPAHLIGRARHARVLTMSGGRPSDVRLALSAEASLALLIVEYADQIRAVLLQEQLDDAAVVADRLSRVVRDVNERLGTQLQAGLSEPLPADDPLGAAALQADAACRVSGPGRCVPVRQVRSRVVLELARAAVRQLPDLGPDPVELLAAHDRRRGSELTKTVRQWIDARGDVAGAAARMSLHPNTLRYRLRCAEAVAGVALDDLSVQLELHLRLPDASAIEPRSEGEWS